MKRNLFFFVLINLIMTALFAVCGYALITDVYENEIDTVKQIAGSVLAEYPEAEAVLISSLEKDDATAKAYGGELIERYGYHGADSFRGSFRYEDSLRKMAGLLGLFFLLLSVGGGLFLWSAEKRRSAQEDRILLLLDGCLRDEFPQDGDFEGLSNAHFADTIKKISHKLQWKTERLNEEHDATKTLVTDISHQLKTPISALRSCFSMAMESTAPEEKEAFLARCGLQIDKLESLSASLIHISRLESRMITLKPESASLVDILVDAVNTVYHKAAEKEMEIVTEEFEDEKFCLDKKWVPEAIANILDNAIKYSPSHTPVHIRVQKRPSFVRVEIEDRGIGIPKEERNKVFQRFYRGDHEIVKTQDGSGVGLYLSRKIIEDSGGTVSVYSAESGGSRFVVQLPRLVS